VKRELEKLVEAAWKAESSEELWCERATDVGYVDGQKRLARHNLAVAKALNKLNGVVKPSNGWEKCPDWVITACYYSMHRSVLAFIASKGWKGRGHEATLGKLIEILREEGKLRLAEEIGDKVNEARKLRIAASYTVFSPEEFQLKIRPLLVDVELILERLGV